jgi:hypothetical protein
MMRARIWLALAVLAMTCTTAWAAQPVTPSPKPAALTAEQLVYPGASVETRIDVNGEAAMALAGGAVDALAAQVQARMEAARAAEAAAAAAQGAGAQAQRAAAEAQRAAAQAIEQARDALKSLQTVKVVVMETKEAVKASDFLSHYQGLLGSRGWTPLVTVQSDKEDNSVVMVMLGPAGKGLLGAVHDDNDIVIAMLITEKPLGELIGMLTKGGSVGELIGPLVGPLAGVFGKAGPPTPPTPPTPPEAPAR